ncbi:hypothetical protein QCA50_008925 [Cerrena zonata]|uniref:Uncharacterized protein n=1 Tax=Cerrena zonata TaxID=2478898 RepID=A0AAW0G8M7_9APHY
MIVCVSAGLEEHDVKYLGGMFPIILVERSSAWRPPHAICFDVQPACLVVSDSRPATMLSQFETISASAHQLVDRRHLEVDHAKFTGMVSLSFKPLLLYRSTGFYILD